MGILDWLSGGGIQNPDPKPNQNSYGGGAQNGPDQIDIATGKPFDYEENTNQQASEADRYDQNMRTMGDRTAAQKANTANYADANTTQQLGIDTLGRENSTANYLQGIANGQGQTAADIQAQQNLNQAVASQMGMAANAKGNAGQRAAAFRDAQNQGANMQQRAIADNAMRSFNERMGAAQAYGQMAGQMAGQYGQFGAQQAQQAQFQAEAADRARQMGLQGQLGFYGLGQNAQIADLNAQTHQYGTDTNAGIARSQMDANMMGGLFSGVAGAMTMGAMSDIRAKDEIKYEGAKAYGGGRTDADRTSIERDYGDYLSAEQFAGLSPKDKQVYLQFAAKYPPKDEYAELLGFQPRQHTYPLFDEGEPYQNKIDPAGAKQLDEDNAHVNQLLAAYEKKHGGTVSDANSKSGAQYAGMIKDSVSSMTKNNGIPNAADPPDLQVKYNQPPEITSDENAKLPPDTPKKVDPSMRQLPEKLFETYYRAKGAVGEAANNPSAAYSDIKARAGQLGHAHLDDQRVADKVAYYAPPIDLHEKQETPFQRTEKGTLAKVDGDAAKNSFLDSLMTGILSDETQKTEKKSESFWDFLKPPVKQFENGDIGYHAEKAVYPRNFANTGNERLYKERAEKKAKPDVITSDEKAKQHGQEESGDHNAVSAFLDSLAPFEYRYKNPADAPSQRPEAKGDKYIGVMAQNVEKAPTGKTIVGEDPNGKKYLEFGPMMSAMAAGLGHVHERLKAMEEGKGKK